MSATFKLDMPINQFENFIEIFVIADIHIYVFAFQDGPNKQATVTQGRLPGQNLLTVIVTTTRTLNDSGEQVKHYAGDVIYNISGFIEKNRDTLFQDFKRLLFNSKNPVIIVTIMMMIIKGIRDAGSTADFRILFEILKFETLKFKNLKF